MLSWQYFKEVVQFDELIVLALVLLVKGSPTIFNVRAISVSWNNTFSQSAFSSILLMMILFYVKTLIMSMTSQ